MHTSHTENTFEAAIKVSAEASGTSDLETRSSWMAYLVRRVNDDHIFFFSVNKAICTFPGEFLCFGCPYPPCKAAAPSIDTE